MTAANGYQAAWTVQQGATQTAVAQVDPVRFGAEFIGAAGDALPLRESCRKRGIFGFWRVKK